MLQERNRGHKNQAAAVGESRDQESVSALRGITAEEIGASPSYDRR